MRMTIGTVATSTIASGTAVALMGGTAAEVLVSQVVWLVCLFVGTAVIDFYVERKYGLQA